MANENQVELGDRVKDRITGFAGIVVAKTEWHTGCDRYTVQPEKLKENTLPVMESFDETVLIIVKKQAVVFPKMAAKAQAEKDAQRDANVPVQEPRKIPPGGPRPTPRQF